MQAFDFVHDFAHSSLPDKRLKRRLVCIAEALRGEPALSFPSAMSDSELEGAYRFVGNERVSLEEVLSGHLAQTRRRAKAAGTCVVIHDTSDINAASVDFRIHVSLAVDLTDHLPLGILSVTPIRRGAHEKKAAGAENENLRWWRSVVASETQLGRSAIHLMDREACTNAVLEEFIANKRQFVIRGKGERRVAGTQTTVAAFLREQSIVAEREVHVGKRKAWGNKEDRKTHPPRDARQASLVVTASQIDLPKIGSINVVSVHEPTPPAGESPIEWTLYTTEPISTPEEVLRVVDLYRIRWLIEELFKALKTGCQYEARQLESYEAMLVALGIFLPMALQMLQLRTQARTNSSRPAAGILNAVQLKILATLPRTKKYPQNTVREAMLAIAGLGGHLKNNGEPGWITLGRGFEKLLAYEEGWRAAMAARKM